MASRAYVNKNDLLQCIIDYRAKAAVAKAEGKALPEIPRYAGECIYKICKKLGSRYNFRGYSYIEELIADAMLDCVKGFVNFDPEKSDNPFGYFTRIAWQAMVRTIEDEHKQTYLKHKNASNLFQDGLHYTSHEHWTDPRAMSAFDKQNSKSTSIQSTDSFSGGASDEVINKYEDTQSRRKAEKEAKALAKAEAAQRIPERDTANTVFA